MIFQEDFDQHQSARFGVPKVDSPRFVSYNGQEQYSDAPSFGGEWKQPVISTLTQQQIQQNNKKKQIIKRIRALTKIQTNITKLVVIIKSKIQSWVLSQSFWNIFQASENKKLSPQSILVEYKISQKLRTLSTIFKRKQKIFLQFCFNELLSASILIHNSSSNTKKLQAIDTKRYHEILLKQNDDRDNINALEIENTYLKKELLRQERQQSTFVDAINGLFDKYDIYNDEVTVTHRPYLTSFCHSPDAEGRRKFTSNAGEKKLKTTKKY